MIVLNCTQHILGKDQEEEIMAEFGSVIIKNLKDLNPELFGKLSNTPDSEEKCMELANELTKFIINEKIKTIILPIGSPFFMFILSKALPNTIRALFAHTDRVSVEESQPDGSVIKKSIFKHKKFLKYPF